MKTLKKALILTIVLLVLCGVIYPLSLTAVSQLAFNKEANGSIIVVDGKEVGSEYIGQDFKDTRFFKSRVSAINYNTYSEEDLQKDNDGKSKYSGVSSGSQNLAPSNEALKDRVDKDIEEFLNNHPGVKKEDIPTDLLTSSGSGLDPHISPEAAKIQISAVSKASGIAEEKLQQILDRNTEDRSLGVFGEPRVNILKVNLEIYSIIKVDK